MTKTLHPPIATVRGSSALCFVVANPIAQVKAPEAMNLLFAMGGVDAVAVPACVTPPRLAPFVREAMALDNARGMMVSIPFKTPLMSVLDRFDAAAAAAGAVNAVRRGEGAALEGALFDGTGFVGALRHHDVPTQGRRALLVGAGGAGLGIACALADTGLAALAVCDAMPQRADALAARVRALSPFPVDAAPDADGAGFDLVIQATPLGLRDGDPLPFDPTRLRPGASVVDILMTQQPTALERACAACGIRVHPGHEMLIQQLPAYLDYFGYGALARELSAPGSHAMRAVRDLIGRRRDAR
jgi:shikimate dehydrogenase